MVRSRDNNGNVMTGSHTNPTRMYQIEFTGDKVTELTSNIIAESIYTQCDSGGNEYLLLDVFIMEKITRPLFYQTSRSQYDQ